MAHMSPNRGRLLFGVVEKAPEVAQNSHQQFFAHGPGGCFLGWCKRRPRLPRSPIKNTLLMAHMSPNRGRLLFGVVEKAPEVAQQKYFAHGPHVSKQREAAFWGGVKGTRGCPEIPSKILCSWPTCLQTEGGCFLGNPIKNTNRGRLLFGVIQTAPDVAQNSHQNILLMAHMSPSRGRLLSGVV